MNNQTPVQPFVPASKSLPELTFRVFVLGSLLTALLGASNVYLGLKLGTTIAASIPAAVISMSILRFFKNYNVLENNIVQTMASAGEGVAAAVAYVLPGLVIIGYWQHFDYLTIMCLVTLGGILGVLISVPLRRVMLSHLKLPFPEGTAVGQVLKSSASGQTNIKPLWQGGLFGAVVSLLQTGFQVCADNLQVWFVTAKSSIHGCGFGFSPAMIAAGYIIGPATSLALFAGVVLGWFIGLPILAHMYGLPHADSAYGAAVDLWKHHLRFVGVGTMLLGGFWTLITLFRPIYQGITLSMRSLKQMHDKANASGKVGIPRTERDIPMHYLLWGSVLLTGIAFVIFFYITASTPLAHYPGTHYTMSIIGALFILVGGLLVASVAAYTSGLIGMTNTPLSGLVLVSVLLLSSILLLCCKTHIHIDASHTIAAVTTVLLVTAVVSVVASISGENMQDLKAGEIVGATPWKQQVILFAGVFIAALVVGPTLELLYQAYGMGGTFPRPGMNPTQMLPAPQASLIATVTEGVFGNSLSWKDIQMGMGVALFCILIDKWLKTYTKNGRLPVLAVGLSIYLPPEVMLPIIMGGVIHWLAHHKLTREHAPKLAIRERMETGNLLACGLVAGSALIGVFLAIPFVIKGSSDALKLVSDGFQHYAEGLGVLVTLILCVWIYRTATTAKK